MSLLRSLRKPIILVFLVILPSRLPEVYENYFGSAGNWQGGFSFVGHWLEGHQIFFGHVFLFIAVASSVWLNRIAEKEKSDAWVLLSGIATISLVFFWLMYFSFSRISFP